MNSDIKIEPVFYKQVPIAYKIHNFLNNVTCNFLGGYYLQHPDLKEEIPVPANIKSNGACTYSLGNDTLSLHISYSLLSIVESILQKQLLPTYTYLRVYENGAELIEHKDKEECEVSVTLNIHHDTNQDEKFYISDSYKDTLNREVVSIPSKRGDAILFFGMHKFNNDDVGFVHWREPVMSEKMIQLFTHYVYKDGKRKHLALK